jgi:hypothetical protein
MMVPFDEGNAREGTILQWIDECDRLRDVT